MPIAIACPSCKARLQAPDSAVGKRVKCPKCQTPIPVPAAGESPAPAKQSAPAPSKAPAKKSAPSNDFDFDDDDRPAPKKGAPARRGRDDDDDDPDDRPAPKKGGAIRKGRDDDFDDEPPPKKGAIKKSRDDDYDDEPPPRKGKGKAAADDDYDDDDDRPRGKKGKKGGGPSGPTTDEERSNAFMVWVIALVGQFIGIGPIGGIVWWFMKKGESKFVDHHGKELVNLMITNFLVVIVGVVFFVIGGVLASQDMGMVGVIFFALGGLLMGIYGLMTMIFFLIAMFKAKGGDWYRIPVIIHLLKV